MTRIGSGEDGGGQRMLASALNGGSHAKHLVIRPSGRGLDGHEPRAPFGQRAGFIEDERVDAGEPLERFRIANQHARAPITCAPTPSSQWY